MSNVLIGIIGVILFIGLALAGALFLGPRFQEATVNSKAAAYVEALKQTAHAADLSAITTGAPPAGGDASTLVGGGYLKSAPINPVWPAASPSLTSEDGYTSKPPTMIVAGMPGSTDYATFCLAINRQVGLAPAADGSPPVLSAPPPNPVGCFKLSPPWGQITGGDFIVYARI